MAQQARWARVADGRGQRNHEDREEQCRIEQ